MEELRPLDDIGEEDLVISMGPQHPSTHGVLRLVLKTRGEVVLQVTPHVGYLHRALEKIAERVNYAQFMPYTDRLDYVAAMNCNLAYARAVEKLLGVEVPPRADFIRVIMAELNRIASHLIFFATYGLDLGSLTPFFYGFREREGILDLFEMASGMRLTYNYIKIGGVWKDLPPGFVDKAYEFLDYFLPRLDEYDRILTDNKIFIGRTAGIGILPADMAIEYGVTGPNLRGAGVAWDIRKDEPYCGYDQFDFEVPVGKGEMGKLGDCWDRYVVRMQEMRESCRLIRQALDRLPDGPTMGRVARVMRPKAGEVYVRSENPRGELGFFLISNGSAKPYRLKIRTGSFTALSVLPEIAKGWMVADVCAIFGSLDVISPEVDR
ncbi:MAG: NADH-quinone oxidoreductase subunit D [Thermodesulfobacteriota bacterium]